jgi:hypothetical protein
MLIAKDLEAHLPVLGDLIAIMRRWIFGAVE